MRFSISKQTNENSSEGVISACLPVSFCRWTRSHLPLWKYYHESHQLYLIVFEFDIIDAVIWRTPRLPTSRPEAPSIDFFASFTPGIAYTVCNTTTYTPVSTVLITLSTSPGTFLTRFFSSLCISTWVSFIWVGLFVFFNVIISSTVLIPLSFWASWLFCLIMTSVSDSLNWLWSVLFSCLFLRLKTITKSTGWINQ